MAELDNGGNRLVCISGGYARGCVVSRRGCMWGSSTGVLVRIEQRNNS